MNKKWLYLAIGFALGAMLVVTIDGLSRVTDWSDHDAFFFISNLLSWRVGNFVKPVLGVIAVILALRGKLKAAISVMLGYFLYESFAGMVSAIVYWP